MDESAGESAPGVHDHPIPDPPSDINKLLNLIDCDEVSKLVETLQTSLVIHDRNITQTVREQDSMCKTVRLLAAGIAQKLPRSYKLAMKSDESEEWRQACDKEIAMLRRMKVWEEVDLPDGKRAVSSKWVFNKKSNSDGVVTKYKSRFVVCGFSQEQGVDFNETFAPTARFSSLMILFAIKVKKGWIIKGFDVVSAYPHSPIEEEIYILPPDGYPCSDPSKVLLLRRALYGTKQAARCWWKFFSKVLSKIGCSYCVNDQSLYVLKHQSETAVIWIHVDDGQICALGQNIINHIRKALEQSFELVWQDEVDQIVGVKVDVRRDGIFLSQPHLTRTILEENGFMTSSAATPMVAGLILATAAEGAAPIDQSKYLSVIGSLSYLAVGTRPDIAFTVNYLARFSAKPQNEHWVALKHLLRYLSGSRNEGILLKNDDVNGELEVFCDSNWGGEYSRSTHGFVIFLFGCPVSWMSRRQGCVATSTCHAEYMALGMTARETVWVINVIEELIGVKMKAII